MIESHIGKEGLHFDVSYIFPVGLLKAHKLTRIVDLWLVDNFIKYPCLHGDKHDVVTLEEN